MTDVFDPPGDSLARPNGSGAVAVDLASLLEQSLGGDEVAFAAVYDATAARAYGLGLRVLNDPVQAAEVVKDAYLHLWTHSGGFQPDRGSAISWILMIVHQRAVSRVRSAEALVAPDDVSVPTDADPTHRALAGLSSIQREAVELAYCEGYTHTEVGEMNGLPVGTAQLRIRDGLLELHDAMGAR